MRFQFRLRTMFVLVTVVAVVCAWIGHEIRVVDERKAMLAWIEKNGGICTIDSTSPEPQADEPSFIRRWLGDQRVDEVFFIPPKEANVVERVKAILPGTVVSNIRW
jgi:hypothetical protein